MPPRQSPAQKLAAKLLLGGEWAPVTNKIGFIKQPLDEAAVEWRQWVQGSPYQPRGGIGVTEHKGTLRELLGKLLPLGYGTRWLLLETTNPEWTAVMENTTGDANFYLPLQVHFPEARGIPIIEVEDEPKNMKRLPDEMARGRWGGRSLKIYDEAGKWRGLSLYQSEPWKFHHGGEPYDFEDVEQYSAPRALDCFPHETLVHICRNLGLDPFEEDFYVPNGRAFIVELLHDGKRSGGKKYTLAEARAGYDDISVQRVDDPVIGNALYPSGAVNPHPDAVFPSTGHKPYVKPTLWDLAVKEFEESLKRYSSYPVRASLSEGLEELGVLGLPSRSSGGSGSTSISVMATPTLLESPAAVREYTAAFMILQWTQADDSSAYKSFYPNRKQMAVIRRIYKEQGLYPFDVNSNGVYFTLAVDKMIRTVTSLRLTDELVDWEASRAKPKLGEMAAYDGRNRSCAWEIRMHIQGHEDEIWNTGLDARV
ncbi:hypothetical protein [Paenarthrobacter nitroguajacolicus]|uniref:hypothetical protein n=1 Tax=Paenarthrobacter nitroguajacolicus TaxID=211146 RepID=UPI0015BB4398|nr:hypothetical protein [Paenarthrobacter nitroguajacolicus]NWL35161.1 hypothetical protein [Paenarthrobacter nitroguajacolicus]